MVIETKSLFGLEDFSTIEFECKKCHSISALPIDGIVQWPRQCLNCQLFFMDAQAEAIGDSIDNLRISISRLKSSKDKRNFEIRFSLKS
jgi:hypothetical protein